jgi:hypothetical protein
MSVILNQAEKLVTNGLNDFFVANRGIHEADHRNFIDGFGPKVAAGR